MKPIKPVGKVQQEPKLNRKERSSLAYQMTVEGTNSQSDFIAMIDNKVKNGKAKDKLSEAIKIAIASKSDDKKYNLTWLEILQAFKLAFEKSYDDSDISDVFDMRSEELDSFNTLASSLKEKYKEKKKPVLNKSQKTEFDILANGFIKDWKSERDDLVVKTIDEILEHMRIDILTSLNVDQKNIYPISVLTKKDILNPNVGDSPLDPHVGDLPLDPHVGDTFDSSFKCNCVVDSKSNF